MRKTKGKITRKKEFPILEVSKTLKVLFLFFILLIVAVLSINYVYVHYILSKKLIMTQQESYTPQLEALRGKTLGIAFVGDSHTVFAANPHYINDSVNFATNAENYVKTYYKLRNVVENYNVTIKTLVLEIDLQTFSGALTDDTNLMSDVWFYKKFISYNDLSKIMNESIVNVWLDSNTPLFGKGNELIQYLSFIPQKSYNGWVESTDNFNTKDKEMLASKTYELLFNHQERISQPSMNAFKNILYYAHNNNITLVFIRYPVTKEYLDMIKNNNISQEQYYDKVFSVINNVTTNYTFIDYSAIFVDHPEYFSDAHHLNVKGSEILSIKLYTVLNTLNVSNTHIISGENRIR